jgi:hypothetical protein
MLQPDTTKLQQDENNGNTGALETDLQHMADTFGRASSQETPPLKGQTDSAANQTEALLADSMAGSTTKMNQDMTQLKSTLGTIGKMCPALPSVQVTA